jgi:hypothetical protein
LYSSIVDQYHHRPPPSSAITAIGLKGNNGRERKTYGRRLVGFYHNYP